MYGGGRKMRMGNKPSKIFIDKTPDQQPKWVEDLQNDLFLKQWSAKKGANQELIDHIKYLITHLLDQERKEMAEWIEKQDWECFEQEQIKKDIIHQLNS